MNKRRQLNLFFLFTDTDSFLYEIQTEDLNKDILTRIYLNILTYPTMHKVIHSIW